MSHFIVKVGDQYQGPRRATGRLYENRTCLVDDIGEARVFNTKGAATSSKNNAGLGGEVLPVQLIIGEPA